MSNPDRDEGGSAFPVPETENHYYIQGMTLRDYFAGQALTGLCAASEKVEDLDHVAVLAYGIADDMMDARKVTNG